jgi:hypothetical protein
METQKELFTDFDLCQPQLRKAILDKNNRRTNDFVEHWMKLPLSEKESA